jgi:DNA polymerase III alpha subunit
VDLRKCHKGAVAALAKAGALASLVPNTKWFLENLEEMWAYRDKAAWNDWMERLEASEGEPDYDADERSLVAAEVSPLAFGKHPLEPHFDFLDSLPVKWVTTGGDDIWEHKWAWVRGVVVEIRYNQVGDFHSGEEPDADTKKRMRWGARYANINLEDPSGENKRVKVNHDTFDTYRHIVDRGSGVPVVALVSVAAKWKSLKVKLMFDVNELRGKLASGEPWTKDELALVRPTKLLAGYKREDLVRAAKRVRPGARATGVAYVTSRDVKPDKNMNQMAWVGLYSRGGLIEALAFASTWPEVKDVLEPGSLVKVTVTRSKDGGAYFVESASLIRPPKSTASE